MKKKIRNIGICLLVILWLSLTLCLWFGPRQTLSESERRPLAQAPEFTADSFLNGNFFKNFEDFSLDQFPLRDGFRTVKSLFTYYVLQQKDNNGIYLHDGYAAKLEYPLNQSSVDYAVDKFQHIKDTYLQDSKVVMGIVPDKGYYLAPQLGYPAMDYESLFTQLQERLPWAQFVDLTGQLSVKDYYRTDTHWRQEQLLPVAGALCEALGVSSPQADAFTATTLDRPFYGVYYGQAALPMEPETITLMESDWLSDCRVYNHETGSYAEVYDMTKLDSQDLYDVYLSGAQALLTIENPNAPQDKELIVFRDSYGSSIVPLLCENYGKVTLVDLRYISSQMLGEYLDFHRQDVLMLYSTLILNSSKTLK